MAENISVTAVQWIALGLILVGWIWVLRVRGFRSAIGIPWWLQLVIGAGIWYLLVR